MKCTALLLLGVLLLSTDAAPPRYKVFPETVSPDGAWRLAWGTKLPATADLKTLVEIPYGEHFDPAEIQVQDYLVPTRRLTSGRAPLPLPGITYFSGIDGHEDHHGLSHAWARDSSAVLVVYEEETRFLVVSYVDVKRGAIHDLGPALEREVRAHARERFSAEAEGRCTYLRISRLGLPEPNLLAADLILSEPAVPNQPPVEYAFRMRFRVEADAGAVKLTAGSTRLLWEEDFKDDPYALPEEGVEDALRKAIVKLAQALKPTAREAFKQEQIRWLKQRDELANKWNRVGFTRARIEQLAILADE